MPTNTRITVPIKKSTVRLYNFDTSIKKKDIEDMIQAKTKTTLDEIEISDIIKMNNGYYAT